MNTVVTLFISFLTFTLSGCGQVSQADEEVMPVSGSRSHADLETLERMLERPAVRTGAPEVIVLGTMVHLGRGRCSHMLAPPSALALARECARKVAPDGTFFGEAACRTYMTAGENRRFCRLLEDAAHWAQAGQIGFILTAAALIENYREE